MFASKCLGATLCHDGCSLRSRGSWLGGSLVSALSFVASSPSEVALCVFCGWLLCLLSWSRACVNMAQKLSFACVEMQDILREGWHTSCYPNSQEHIAVHSPCFLVLFFVWLLLCFCVCFAFCGFCLFAFLLICARSRQLDSCKGPHLLSFVAFFTDGFACISIQFRQVEACVTTWRKPWRRWTEKKTSH